MILSRIRSHLSPSLYLPLRTQLKYKPNFIISKPCYFFSQKNEKQNEEKKSIWDKQISLAELAQIFQKKDKKNKKQQAQKPKQNFNPLLLLFFPFLASCLSYEKEQDYPLNYFEQQITKDSQELKELNIMINVFSGSTSYTVHFVRNGRRYRVCFGTNGQLLNQILKHKEPSIKVNYSYINGIENRLGLPIILINILSILAIASFFTRSTSMTSGIKKGGSNIYQQLLGQKKVFDVIHKTNVRFADVAGLDQCKIQVQQFVDFLKNPERYKKLGARIPKGVMLSGPPGTGKTMLAKACAGQAGVPFIPTSGSDFVQIFVGIGASRVRDLFGTAKQKSPAIIFIDEIDAVGRKRSGSHGSHDERDNTLNQILVEMDGFTTDANVIVMAATNRLNLLDDALKRPGRFDRMVEVNLPDLEGRRQIFNVHLKKIKIEPGKTMEQFARRLASLTPGFSGAEIANLCNQAALLAARNNKDYADAHDFEMATQRLIGGIEKKGIISTHEKKIVSVHESGHAVVSWFLQGADPLLKLTIIPRSKGSLGFAQYLNSQNKLNTKSQLIDQICFILGGRCAQEHFFGTCTNGAADDLEKAYKIAHNIVIKLGMNQKVGYVGFRDSEYLRPYSQEMGSEIDRQIQKLIADCTARTKQMVKKYAHLIQNLSDQLFDKQTLTIKQIRKILGERQFQNHEVYQNFLQIEKQSEEATST